MTPVSESLELASRAGWRRRIAVAIGLAAIAGGLAAWVYFRGRATERELAAKVELDRLGALVVMDAQRKHVSSVNLSTLKSPESLDHAIVLLPALTHLSSLHADNTALRDEHAIVVGQLVSLQNLVLSRTAITDLALESLPRLSRLKSIHLADTAVTNACLPMLGRLRALTIIDLSGTKVTGNFAPLGNLANLNWLVARRLSLDAAAIAAVGECPSLSRLTLSETTCPPEALNELEKKKPNLTIDR